MQHKELITIIVPVYNIHQYLDECVRSLINQVYTNLEIILVDDGSTDGSGGLCDEWAQKDCRIKVIHKKNGGLSDARNAALRIMKGAYVGFVDSDDWIANDMFKKLMEACLRENAEIAVCGMQRVYMDGTEDFIPSKTAGFTREAGLTELFKGRMFGDQACTKMYKASLFEGIEYPVGRLFEDMFTTYKLFLRASRIATVAEPLYFYRQRRGSITGAGYNLKKLDIIESLKSIRQDNQIVGNPEWQEALKLRESEVTCWSLIDMFIAGNNIDAEQRKREMELFRHVQKRRLATLQGTRYRSCKLLALLSCLGYSLTRALVASGPVSRKIKSQHQYYS